MANEVYYSGSGDLRLTEVLNAELRMSLADRFSLLGHPSIYYAGNVGASGSTTIKVGLADLDGVNRLSAVAENASVTNTALTDSSVTLTVARQAMQRSISDLNAMADSIGLNVQALVADGVGAFAMRWMEMLCSLLGGFSSTVGTTTVDLTSDDFFSAMFTLMQASVPPPYLAVLHNVQFTDLLNSIRGEAGPFQYRTDAQDIFTAKGQGIKGSLLGVDIVDSSLVPTANAGADSAGAMFGRGALGYIDGLPRSIQGAGGLVVQAGSRMFSELSRDASGALTKITHNAYLGFAEIEDARGVSIITDR